MIAAVSPWFTFFEDSDGWKVRDGASGLRDADVRP